MKNVLLSILMLFSINSIANEPLELDLDLQNEFAVLEKLENAVELDNELTLEALTANNSELLEGVSIANESSVATVGDQMPILGAFWWGCCLGVVGLLIVYIVTDNDKDQMKSALIGCVIVTLIAGIGGFINPFGWF